VVDLNPKLKDSGVIDCKPQKGKCPLDCNQCFYNREGAFYTDINRSQFPSMFEVGKNIVRVNPGHDSNIEKEEVLKETEKYEHKFYNTSIMDFKFPAPVVFTANRKEEETIPTITLPIPTNLMFVRLRVSDTNLDHIYSAIVFWAKHNVPVVLTFMAYYSEEPKNKENYEWQVRHTNSYWYPTKKFMKEVLKRMKKVGGRLVTMCGTLDSRYCEQCGNCKNYYLQTIKHMNETKEEENE
jgi:hypothetical protein